MNFDNYLIREVQPADAERYFSLVDTNRQRLSRYFPKTLLANTSLEATLFHLSERARLMRDKELYTFVIEERESARIIGTVFVKDIDWSIPKAELGFFLDGELEGKGIMTRSVGFVIRHCFETIGLNKIYMRVEEENLASRRVAEKNGFSLEGTLRNDFKTSDGKLIDLLYYGLLKPAS